MIVHLVFVLLRFICLTGNVEGETIEVQPTPSFQAAGTSSVQLELSNSDSTNESPLIPSMSLVSETSLYGTLPLYVHSSITIDQSSTSNSIHHQSTVSHWLSIDLSTINDISSHSTSENSSYLMSQLGKTTVPRLSTNIIVNSIPSVTISASPVSISMIQTNSLLVTPMPTVSNEGQYFVSIKSDDCPKMRSNKFDHELSKALAALGVLNVTANIARTKCQTQLSVNITATAPSSAIKLLEQSRKLNLTITVFNRTFKIVDIKRLNPTSGEMEVFNSSSTVISVVAKNEFNAYIAVALCFFLVLIVCVSVCCVKCWSGDPNKRLSINRNSHSPLNPDDYTLTPLPRPTSLYVDYYRNSFSAEIRSTTSVGSVGSTSTAGDKVVQPFDTSIVPLEDFVVATISGDSRRNSVESSISQKSIENDQTSSKRGLLFFSSMAHSTEKLNPRIVTGGQLKTSGVSNPTYQRY